MRDDKNVCPICLAGGVVDLYNGGYHKYDCPNCGRFMLDQLAHLALTDLDMPLRAQDNYYMRKCRSVMLERKLKNLNNYILICFSQEKRLFFRDTGVKLEDLYPNRFFDKLERGFFNLVRSLPFSQFVKFLPKVFRHDLKSLLFISDSNENELDLLGLMIDEGWISRSPGGAYSLTVKGMNHFEEKGRAPDVCKAFLAMWFGVNGALQYREAINKAVANSGYHLQIVDVEDYNGFIMDKVVNLINDSAFVIADISAAPETIVEGKVAKGVRGGVYWEAGYAAGQKKQVILTCSGDADSTARIHFDLEQYNQIRWKQDGDKIVTVDGRDLVDALTQRILATVGKGQSVTNLQKI